MSTTSKRKTIGVFASQVGRAWGSQFLAGVQAGAEQHDVNLVYFIGGKIIPGADGNSYGFYDLARQNQVDGILLASDTGNGVSDADLAMFRKAYSEIPIVTHSILMENTTMYIPDNINGMRSLLNHLIKDHGYKQIAFIKGILGQVDSEQRYQAYQDVLQEHKIHLNEEYVVAGDFTTESGRDAITLLLDDRKLQFQAVVAANDRMAYGALEALQARKLRVPEDVAVAGFGDLREAQSMGAPLTTVRQSYFTAGRNTIQTLVEKINGAKTKPEILTPTQLLIRWSCGCLPENVKLASVAIKDVAKTGKLENKRESALRALVGAAGITDKDEAAPAFKEIFGQGWDSFLLTINGRKTSDDFLRSIHVMIETMQAHNIPATIWHNVISVMRKYALGGITNPTKMLQAENLFQQARILAGELSQRWQAYQRLAVEQQENVLHGFSFSMAPAMSTNEIGQAIVEHFPLMGIKRWYVMFHSDVDSPQSVTTPGIDNYNLFFQYENSRFEIPQNKISIDTGQLVPRGKTPEDHRYSAVVMPLSLAQNQFGFMWTEMGPSDWEIYVRVRNLVSSALLRTRLVLQKQKAQEEVERLLAEAHEHTRQLALAKEFAENTAMENASLYSGEQARRHSAESLANATRQLSSLSSETEVHQQIVSQLSQMIPSDRIALLIEDVNGIPRLRGHKGLPAYVPIEDLSYEINETNVYYAIAKQGQPMVLSDLKTLEGWRQPEWLPLDGTWVGVPVFSKNKVIGMLTMSRKRAGAFTKDDVLLANAFATQASVALDNAKLYDEVKRFNQMMERIVEQRVEELNSALSTVEKLDKNKSDFIQVAAHELRTPLTVIKGYMGMLKAAPEIKDNETLHQAMDGVLQGTDRLSEIVNSMLDVARIEGQIIKPRLESMMLGPLVRMIVKDYEKDINARQISMDVDPQINSLPNLRVDSNLMKKAIDNVVVNAIKFTPDGGSIHISAHIVNENSSEQCQIRVMDSGIGIDKENQKIIFEKLYQIGKVDLHSSGKTKFKGGGPGLGLAIASGIVKAHKGNIWVESPGYDEERFPGSTFYIQIPINGNNL